MFDWVRSKLSQATVTIAYLKSQDMIKILKQSGHNFPGKRLCGGLYLDIIWCLCMEVNNQHRVIWFCEKASLRICYIILCECRSLNIKN